jgi:LPXTG-site transpeptidase (sortase) family protein
MLDGNRRFTSGRLTAHEQDLAILKQNTIEKQEPFAAVLSCADSRVPVELVFDQTIGHIFVIRVAGNVVTPEIIASLEYGAAVLGTKVILVMGRGSCGAVKATIQGKEVPGQISALYAHIQPAVDQAGSNLEAATKAKDSLTKKADIHIAILRIRKINLEVPVFNDTDDLTLNRGVGRIIGTAQVGRSGNLGIAGHRDGFFRGLKDVGPGDLVELTQPGRTSKYVVTQIQIVTPENVSVLDSTPTPTLTLVTCFPFYFVGNAPRRYVVTASLESSSQPDEGVTNNSISTGKKTNNKEKTR